MSSWKDDILFLGMGRDGVCHYRTYLPASRLGCDWATQDTDGTLIQRHAERDDHPVVVYQMPFHPFQVQQMIRMKDAGVRVVLNVDDDLRAVKNMKQEHGLSHHFHKGIIQMHEEAVRQADHLIVSTDWLADRYNHPSTFVCRNGIDLPRYKQSAVESPFDLTIGWAGGTGHEWPMRLIADTVREFVLDTPGAGVFLVGEPKMQGIIDLPQDRFRFFGWMDLWLYPRYVRAFDIGLAPAADHDFFRAKSELRFYENSAAGVAGIYSPVTYGVEAAAFGGVMADSPDEWRAGLELLSDKVERDERARAAGEYVRSNVDMEVRVSEWETALREIVQ